MNLRKPPQERSTAKRMEGREHGEPDIVFRAGDDRITIYEQGEDHWPPTFRGAEEIRDLRDFCEAWLEHHEENEEAEDA